MDIADSHLPTPNAVREVLEQYRRVASAAMDDAEKWLRQGDLSRAIPEALPDALLVTDEGGTIVTVNAEFELMFGYPRREVLGKPMEMLLPESHRSRHVTYRQDFMNHLQIRNMTVRPVICGRRKNGVEIELMIRLGPVVIPSGVYTVAVIRKANPK